MGSGVPGIKERRSKPNARGPNSCNPLPRGKHPLRPVRSLISNADLHRHKRRRRFSRAKARNHITLKSKAKKKKTSTSIHDHASSVDLNSSGANWNRPEWAHFCNLPSREGCGAVLEFSTMAAMAAFTATAVPSTSAAKVVPTIGRQFLQMEMCLLECRCRILEKCMVDGFRVWCCRV